MVSQPRDNGQTLERMIVDDIVRGFSIERTAERHQLDTKDVAGIWRSYVERKTEMSPEEQFVLYTERLENLLTKAHTVLENEMDPDSINAVARVLQMIEELQSLNISRKERLQGDLIALTKGQTAIMLQVLGEMTQGLKESIAQAFDNNRTIKAIKADVLDEWEGMSSDIQMKALETVNSEH